MSEKLKPLSLSDLMVIQTFAYECSVDVLMREQHGYWNGVRRDVEDEIRARIVGIFGEPKSTDEK